MQPCSFPAISRQLSDLLGDSKEGRGTLFVLHRKALVKTSPLNKTSVLGAWQRLSKWLDFVEADEFPENLHPSFIRLVNFLQDQNPESAPVLQQTMSCLQDGATESHVAAIQELAEAARKQEHLKQKESYQEWLHQGAQGSLKPIYRSIKAHEAQVVRPFLDRPFELRPYLNFVSGKKFGAVQATMLTRSFLS